MIKNERQYQLSKAQIREFESASAAADQAGTEADIHPRLAAAQRDAIRSQIEELNHEVREYEAIKSGKLMNFEAQSLDDLPLLLVKARIARGITHKELAGRLGVKEQQVQRWEVNDFAGASLENLRAIADALGVVLMQQLFIPGREVNAKTFLDHLSQAGLQTDFLLRRIMPIQVADAFRSGKATLKEIIHAAGTVAKVFELDIKNLLELAAPKFNFPLVAATRFKLPARLNKQAVTGYTIYAHYLAALVSQCAEHPTTRTFPVTAHDFFAAVSEGGSPMSI